MFIFFPCLFPCLFNLSHSEVWLKFILACKVNCLTDPFTIRSPASLLYLYLLNTFVLWLAQIVKFNYYVIACCPYLPKKKQTSKQKTPTVLKLLACICKATIPRESRRIINIESGHDFMIMQLRHENAMFS